MRRGHQRGPAGVQYRQGPRSDIRSGIAAGRKGSFRWFLWRGKHPWQGRCMPATAFPPMAADSRVTPWKPTA